VANIGSMAVLLSSNADEFSKGLEKASRSIDKFGSSVARMKGAVVAPLESIAEKARDLLSAIPFIGTAFGAIPVSAAGFVTWLKEGMDEIKETSKLSRTLGLDLETLAGIQFMAGGSAEAMEKGLFHASRMLGEAASGSKEASKKFAELGLDGKALSAMTFADALLVISSRYRGLASQAERNALAFELFSKSAPAFTKLMMGGSEALASAIEQARGFGTVLDTIDVSNVLKAERALTDIKIALSGIQTQAAIAFAPLVTVLGTWVTDFLKDSEGLKDFWQKAAEYTGIGIASMLRGFGAIIDTVEALMGKLDELLGKQGSFDNWLKGGGTAFGDSPASQGGPTAFLAYLKSLFSSDKKKDEHPEFDGGGGVDFNEPEMGKTASQRLGIEEKAKAFENLGEAAKKAAAGIDSVDEASLAQSRSIAEAAEAQEKIIKSVGELELSLQGQVRAFGNSGEAAKLWELSQKGAPDSMLAVARAAGIELAALKKVSELQGGPDLHLPDRLERFAAGQAAKAREVFLAGASPMQKFAAQFDQIPTRGISVFEQYAGQVRKLNALLKEGTVSQIGFQNATAKLNEEFEKKKDSRALDYFEKASTPLEKFLAEKKELHGYLEEGRLDLLTYQRSLSSTFETMAGKHDFPKPPAGLAQGSSGAISAVTQATMRGNDSRDKDPQRRVEEALKQQLVVERQAADYARRTADAIDNIFVRGI
jgi:hypothetical protein